MEKLTHILTVVETLDDGIPLLDKSVALARRFDARVELLVAESRLARAFTAVAVERGYTEVFLSSAHRGATPLHEVILRRVDFGQPDIIVKAPSPRHADESGLAVSDWLLASQCSVPILLARARPWQRLARFAVALDVTDERSEQSSRRLLQAAEFFTRRCRGNLDILYSERELRDEDLRRKHATDVTRLVREFHAGCERLQMFDGDASHRLPSLIAERNYDVVVIGTGLVTHGWMAPHLAASHEIAMATTGDILVLRADADPEARMGASRLESRRHERLDEAQ